MWKNSKKAPRFIAQKRGNFPKKFYSSRAFTSFQTGYSGWQYKRKFLDNKILWYTSLKVQFLGILSSCQSPTTHTQWTNLIWKKDCSSFELPGIYNQSSIKTRFVKGKTFFFKKHSKMLRGVKKGFVTSSHMTQQYVQQVANLLGGFFKLASRWCVDFAKVGPFSIDCCFTRGQWTIKGHLKV